MLKGRLSADFVMGPTGPSDGPDYLLESARKVHVLYNARNNLPAEPSDAITRANPVNYARKNHFIRFYNNESELDISFQRLLYHSKNENISMSDDNEIKVSQQGD